jgi:hypothetical protein
LHLTNSVAYTKLLVVTWSAVTYFVIFIVTSANYTCVRNILTRETMHIVGNIEKTSINKLYHGIDIRN